MAEQEIVIDGNSYPFDTWELEEQGRVIERRFTRGYRAGMGAYLSEAGDDYLIARNFDTTSHPYLRLRPRFSASISINNFGQNQFHGAWGFLEQSPGGTEFLYLLNGQRSFKINLSTNTLEETKDFSSNAGVGHPALFNSQWYVPLSFIVPAQKLTAIADPGGTDTWSVVTGIAAFHFANIQKGASAQLVRVGPGVNEISLSLDGATFGDAFEFGDTSLFASDMLRYSAIEVIIIRADGLWRQNAFGTAVQVMTLVGQGTSGKGVSAHLLGNNAHQHGAFTYWPHNSGLWRILGLGGIPIGPDALDSWVDTTRDSFKAFSGTQWDSVTGWGGWLYATYGPSLFYGLIRSDGSVLWHGPLYHEPAQLLRCLITESGPDLWITSTTQTIHRMPLNRDGSPKSSFGSNRGAASETCQFWGSEVNAGPGNEDKLVQWRRMFVKTENWVSTAPLQLAAHMDGNATSTNVGATITASGYFERTFTAGSDTAYGAIPTLKILTEAGYNPATSDPRIRFWGIQGVSPAIYSARIPLTDERMKGFSIGIRGARRKLRDLKNGQTVSVRAPKDTSSFSGQIVGVDEEIKDGDEALIVFIQRWDWSSSS